MRYEIVNRNLSSKYQISKAQLNNRLNFQEESADFAEKF